MVYIFKYSFSHQGDFLKEVKGLSQQSKSKTRYLFKRYVQTRNYRLNVEIK